MSSKDKKYHLPAALIIIDGFGLKEPSPANAIFQASTPNLDELFKNFSSTKLNASGEFVGLPDGQMGNSEVGHLNIGAGRVVAQELTRINQACQDGSISKNDVVMSAFDHVKKSHSCLHLMGLLSDGGVHSSIEHLFALIDAACKSNVKTIRIHAFLDGRDVPPKSGISYLQMLEDKILQCKNEYDNLDLKIASVCGRYYAMDRDNRWERVEEAYDSIVLSENYCAGKTPIEYLHQSYEEGITDEFVKPAAFCQKGIRGGDACIFFNFRPDRAREITSAIALDDFSGFQRVAIDDLFFVCMTTYDETFDLSVAFEKSYPDDVLADVISRAGLKQLHTAETEKYAHVTFFFNGGIEKPKSGEMRILVDSPKVATYDQKPEMSAFEVTEKLVCAIQNDEADFYIVNFANCDMVGHTGVLQAAIKAVETVDECVGAVVKAICERQGFALITADHGNADQMICEDGTPHTAHTTAKVPLILADFTGQNLELKDDGEFALSDIAPTMLTCAGLEIPAQMTGKILIK